MGVLPTEYLKPDSMEVVVKFGWEWLNGDVEKSRLKKEGASDMKHIDWNQMSELGLLERINREILHPLGLAACCEEDTGISFKVLVADDGVWEFDPEMETTIISNEEVRACLLKMVQEDSDTIMITPYIKEFVPTSVTPGIKKLCFSGNSADRKELKT